MKLRLSRRIRRWLTSAVIWMMVPLAALAGRASVACVCVDGRVQSLCPTIWPSAAATSCCSRQPGKTNCCNEGGRAAGDHTGRIQPGSCCRSVLASAAVEVRRVDTGAATGEGALAAWAAMSLLPLVDPVAAHDVRGAASGLAPADLPIALSRLTI